ncbi:putative wd40 protein [Trichoderma velutinum]
MDKSKYTVGWICALTEEFVAAQAFLDETHERLKENDPRDSNSYALGKMSGHNIVIACLPLGEYGTASAAGVAINMVRSFPNIRIGLMVGIGGGAPSKRHDIRLGDIVVSTPGNGNGGVFQYDFGKSIQAKEFIETGFLNQPPEMLRTALQAVKSSYQLKGHTLINDVEQVLQNKPRLKKAYCRPNIVDRLHISTFIHANPSEDCQSCGNNPYHVKWRDPRDEDEDDPAIHYGLIASGNRVMNDAQIRDKFAMERDVLCFEMEAAGLINRFPCLVIRGICDYSDSHKNNKWRGYAAIMAAAYTKDFLRHLIPEQVVAGKSAIDLLQGIHGELENLVQKTDIVSYKLDLAKLSTAHGAEFDSFANQHDDECLLGTRTGILRLIREWAISPQGKCIFWLNGMAGTGKSTICRTLAKYFQEKKLLGATFFFRRGEADRGNASKFFPTIARQIYQKIPEIDVRKVFEHQPDFSNKSLSTQFKKLILQPLTSLHSTNRELPLMIIVIDALDECGDDNDIRAIIQLLPQVQATKSIRLRVFITSRPELPIRLGFKDVEGDYQDLVLHHVPMAEIEHDISLFITHKLDSIREYRFLSQGWPGGIKIQLLVTISVPLFIFAATVCRMLQDHDLVPEETLEDIFKYQNKESKLDAVYLPVLNRLCSKYGKNGRDRQFAQVRELVSAIVLLENPLSIISLSNLFGIPTATIQIRLNSLHSVLNIPIEETAPVRLFHLSFRDFLLDRETCKKTTLWVDEKATHGRLTAQCLLRMSNSLKRNICNLSDYGLRPEEINADIINLYIPPELQYSCHYWVYHLGKSQKSATLIESALLFLQEHLLHWIEAMGILGLASDVIYDIQNLQSIAQGGQNIDMLELLYDARRFILKFRYVADAAPLQLYLSGLTFAPNCSIIKKLFLKDRPDWISIPKRIEDKWDAQLQTLEGHAEKLRSIAFSSNGILIASGAEDCTVKIWETATGTLRQTFTGYRDSILRVAFSLDAQILASISRDGIIKLWNVATGVLQRSINHKTDAIYDATFSLDIGLLATRGLLKTVIWDLSLGIQKYELCGRSFANPSLMFSADGLLLASASGSDIIIWDTTTGAVRQTNKSQSKKEWVESLAFSSNGQLLASSHRNFTVKLWDAITGTQQYSFNSHSLENQVVFSPDNQFLAISHPEGTTIWDIATYRVHRENSNPASIIAYSPDGRTLASSYRNGTIELWDLDMEFLNKKLCDLDAEFLDKKPHTKSIEEIEFFSDGNLVISLNGSKISIWSSSQETLQQDFVSYMNHNETEQDAQNLVALSADGRLLAYPFNPLGDFGPKFGVKVWDLKTSTGWSILIKGIYLCDKMAFSPNNHQFAAVGNGIISFWAYTGDFTQCLSPKKSNDSIAGSWDLQRTIDFSEKYTQLKVSSISFSPDGRQLALCFSVFPGVTVNIWDCTTGLLVQTLEYCAKNLESVAFSINGQLLAREKCYEENIESTIHYPIIEPWDMITGKVHKAIKARHTLSQMALSTRPTPFDDLEFSKFQNRYAKRKDITVDITVFEKEWVCFQGRKILWLPPKYRTTCSAASNTTLAFRHGKTEMTFIKFSELAEFKM